MFVIIAGGGKTGSQLASQLLSAGHTVRLIEDRPSVLERLQEEIPNEVIFAGDASSPSVLDSAGVREAQSLPIMTARS